MKILVSQDTIRDVSYGKEVSVEVATSIEGEHIEHTRRISCLYSKDVDRICPTSIRIVISTQFLAQDSNSLLSPDVFILVNSKSRMVTQVYATLKEPLTIILYNASNYHHSVLTHQRALDGDIPKLSKLILNQNADVMTDCQSTNGLKLFRPYEYLYTVLK